MMNIMEGLFKSKKKGSNFVLVKYKRMCLAVLEKSENFKSFDANYSYFATTEATIVNKLTSDTINRVVFNIIEASFSVLTNVQSMALLGIHTERSQTRLETTRSK